MDKNNYNVDDILEEIKRRKSKERPGTSPARHTAANPTGKAASQQAPTPASTAPPAVQNTAQPPMAEEPLPTLGKGFVFAPENTPPVTSSKESPRPFADSVENTTSFEPPVRPAKKHQKAEDGFPLTPPKTNLPNKGNPLNFDGHVRPITEKAQIRRERSPLHPIAPPQEPELQFSAPRPSPPSSPQPAPPPRQRSAKGEVIDFSAFRPPAEDMEAGFPKSLDFQAPLPHQDTRVMSPQELARSREFQLEEIQRIDFGAVSGSYDYYDEDDDLEEDFVPTTPLDMSEYNSTADRGAVARDIARVKLWLFVRCLFTGILTIALFYTTLAGKYPLDLPGFMFPEENMRMYMLAITVLSVLVALVSSSSVGGGLISLFKMRANSDTLPALALLAAIGQSVAGTVRPEAVVPENLGLFPCVAALAMFFNALGKTTMINRIQLNFRILSSKSPKRAVLPVQSEEFCREFVRDTTRRPTVAYSARTGFFTDFLGLSYSDKYDVGIHKWVAPACLFFTILVGILSYALTADSATAISAMAAILCVAATLSSTFVENIPLGKLTKKLAPQGGMVSGNKAVESFCDTRAIVLRDNDLFPDNHIQLHGIKAYSHGRIDEAILDAASVICALDGALSPVFLSMIGGNRKLLKRVDNIVYENGMGVSAWVNSRRVLIGNRRLMQNHGILVPEGSYEQKYAQHNAEAIYLSNSGEVSAQFVVSYHIDEELAAALDQAASRDQRLVVYTCDSNITPHKLWELYGYPEDLIDIMPAEYHSAYKEMSLPRDTAMAEIAYTGKASVMVNAITACVNARASILVATVIQLVQIVLGYGMIVFIAFLGAMDALNILQLTVFQLFWFFAIFIVQKVHSS